MAVSDAHVIDAPADLLPHPNGEGWVRLVLTSNASLQLYRELKLVWDRPLRSEPV